LKITNVTTETYRWPRHKPISNGLHTYTHSGLGLVKIHTDEGTMGDGVG
jgi:D-arabinonate dehydratase